VGTIITPCLALEDGAAFQGNIDMDSENEVLRSAFDEVDSEVATRTVDRDEVPGNVEQEEAPTDETEVRREDNA